MLGNNRNQTVGKKVRNGGEGEGHIPPVPACNGAGCVGVGVVVQVVARAGGGGGRRGTKLLSQPRHGNTGRQQSKGVWGRAQGKGK